MLIPPRTILSCSIVGDDLHAARVRVGPIGARVMESTTIERFLAATPEDRRRLLKPLGRSGARLTLVAPGDWCAVRPIALTTKQWAKARTELIQSIDRLLPMTSDDAMAGLINVYDDAGQASSGRLIAIRRRIAEPWLHAIEDAAGAQAATILATHMAMLGLGLQAHERATVLDRVDDESLRHTLRFGLPTSIGEAVNESEESSASAVLPHAGARVDSRAISGVDLAIAGALAPSVAPDAFAPVAGATPARMGEWLAPAAAALLAAALLISAPMIYDARLRAGLADLRAEQAALTEEFQRVRAVRTNTERLATLLHEGVRDPIENWRPAMPVMAEAQGALAGEGFLYRMVVDARGVTISGESDDAGAVLQRLEDSPLLTSARRTGPLMPAPENGWSIFEMRAEREQSGGAP